MIWKKRNENMSNHSEENVVKKRRKKDKIQKINHKKYLKNGSYSVAITAVFLVIVVVINLIVNELPSTYTQIDVSDSKLYSIGEETKKMLKNLEKDVTIYQVAQSGSEDENIQNLLQKYEDSTKHIKVELKDPVVNPQFTGKYTEEQLSPNSLIVESGDRNKVIHYNNMYENTVDYTTYSYKTTGFDGEGQITSAIAYVTSENLPVLYTLEGHGEIELNATMKEDIEKANMEIKSLNLVTETEIPEDADCVMINSPATDISKEEKEAILKYLEDGGKAMIFTDYTGKSLENLEEILANYGVSREEGIVFEGDNQHYAMNMPYFMVPEIGISPAAGDFASSGYLVLAPYAQGIRVSEDIRDTVSVESILTTSEDAYSKVNVNSSQIEKEEGDVEGPFDLGVSITETIDEEKETQIVYYSTANLMDEQMNQMVSGGNERLIMNTLNWMTNSEENQSVAIPAKSMEMGSLTLTAYDAAFWKICVMGLIPGFFLIAGFGIWLKRRKA